MRYLFLLLLFLGSTAFSRDWQEHSLEWRDAQLWTFDDPATAHAWVVPQIAALGPHPDPAKEIKLYAMAVLASIALERFDWIKAHETELRRIWPKAHELGMMDYYLTLVQCFAQYLGGVGRDQESIALFEKALEDARIFGNKLQIMMTLVYFGSQYRNMGEQPKSLKLLLEAQEIAGDSHLVIDPVFRAMTRLVVMVTLQGEGHLADGDMVMDNAFRELEEQNLRNVCSILAYNIATTYSLSKPPNYEKAILYAEKSQRMAHETGDTSTEGATIILLASLHNERGDFAKGLVFAEWADRIVKDNESAWKAYAWREKSKALHHRNRVPEALVAIDKALALLPESYQERRGDLYREKSIILEKLGRFAESLQSYKDHHALQIKVNRGREEDNFAKTKVQLAFQAEEQKNILLKREVESKRYLTMASIALAVLLVLAVISLGFAMLKSRQTARAKLKMQRILEAIDEGILTIGSDLKLRPDYSPYLTQLYPGISAGADAIAVLIPESMGGAEGQSIVRECLQACIGHDMIAWEFNSGHLPAEVVFGPPYPRILSFHWQPLLDPHGLIHGFLLTIRDQTQARILADAVAQEQRYARGLEQKMKELITTRYAEAAGLIQILGSNPRGLSLRELHTQKGVARALALKDLSSALHDVESALKSQQDVDETWLRLEEHLGQYQHLIRDILGVRESAPQEGQALIDMIGPLAQQLRLQLNRAAIPWQGFEVLDQVSAWPLPLLAAARNCLVHALANGVDHGYILPKKSGQDPGAAFFRVEAQETPGAIELIIRDHGVGLNEAKLQRLAEAKHFIPARGETIADVVFLDGVSTSQQVTETSGRGVGLGAVREICRALGGDAHLLPNEPRGSQLRLRFRTSDSSPDAQLRGA